MATTSKMTMASVKSIMNKRTMFPAEAAGKRVVLTIQGNGNTIDVKNKAGELVQSVSEPDGTVLRKRIFNTRANSGIAMSNKLYKDALKAGILAEKAGDAEKAHEKFNEYLNGVQISFGVLLNGKGLKLIDQLSDNTEIEGRLEIITTENGSLMTLNTDTITVVKAETYGKTSFSYDEFETPAEEQPTATEVITKEAEPVKA